MPAGFAPAVDASAAIAAAARAGRAAIGRPGFIKHEPRGKRMARVHDRQHRDDQKREPVRVTAS